MREIDTVTVKGSIRPMRLYTIDLSIKGMIPTEDPLGRKTHKEKKAIRGKKRRTLFERLRSEETTSWNELRQDAEFIELRRNFDRDFERQFKTGYKAYIKGDWVSAGELFAKLLTIRPHDGPVINLNKVINIKHNRKPPEDWKGYRPLTSK